MANKKGGGVAEIFRVESITVEMLKYQNTSLCTRLDVLKHEQEGVLKKQRSYENQVSNYQTLFSHFFGAWKAFLLKLENIHQMAKKSGESRLAPKCQQCFDLLLEISSFTEKIGQEHNEFARLGKDKVGMFVRTFENLYLEFLIDHGRSAERVQQLFTQVQANRNDMNDIARKLFQENKELQNKLTEAEGFFKEKQSYLDHVGVIEGDYAQERVNTLESEIERLKTLNENLARRLRMTSEYNVESVRARIQKGEEVTEIEVPEDENFECICGGSQVAQVKYLREQLQLQQSVTISREGEDDARPMEIENGTAGAQAQSAPSDVIIRNNLQKRQKSGAGEERPQQGNDICDQTLGLTYSDRLNALQRTIDTLVAEKAEQARELKSQQKQISNQEEIFLRSNLYQTLLEQGRELYKHTLTLTKQLQTARERLIEVERLRERETIELLQREQEEREKLQEEIHRLKQAQAQQSLSKSVLGVDIEEIIREHDRSSALEQQRKRIEELLAMLTKQQEAHQATKQAESELRKKLEEEGRRRQDITSRCARAEQDLIAARSRLPEGVDLATLPCKHVRFRELLNEIDSHLREKGLTNYKERITDLATYLLHREKKVLLLFKIYKFMIQLAHIDDKNKQILTENSNLKKQLDQMMNVVELTEKGFEELKNQNKNLQQQLAEKEKIEANLMQQSLKQRLTFEQDKKTWTLKKNADAQYMAKVDQLIEEQRTHVQQLIAEREAYLREHARLREVAEHFRQNAEEQKKIAQQHAQELSLLQHTRDTEQQQTAASLADIEAKNARVIELQACLADKEQRLQELERGLCKQELEKYKERVNCSNCNGKDMKEVFLIRCGHMFCKECIEQNIKQRARACPICRTRFDQKDAKEMFWV